MQVASPRTPTHREFRLCIPQPGRRVSDASDVRDSEKGVPIVQTGRAVGCSGSTTRPGAVS